uniref:Uncharacterized protein n=1 Tax=Panagrolaimus davidi TaxID=227884 RepID=A0A914P794_9BILA
MFDSHSLVSNESDFDVIHSADTVEEPKAVFTTKDYGFDGITIKLFDNDCSCCEFNDQFVTFNGMEEEICSSDSRDNLPDINILQKLASNIRVMNAPLIFLGDAKSTCVSFNFKRMIKMDSSVDSSKLVSIPVFYGKRAWPGGPSIQQNWSLPNSMILYIAKNPTSPKVYQKLVQTCKFFFETHPIIIMAALTTFKNFSQYYISENGHDLCMKIDLNKLSTKIWITQGLFFYKRVENFAEHLLSKIFRCEVSTLGVFDNDIIFDDLKFLVSSAKNVALYRNSIKYKNGTTVMLDKVLECIPTNIEYFCFRIPKDVPMVNASTMSNILKLQNLENLKCFYLFGCPDTISIEDLSIFVKKFKNTQMCLAFDPYISPEYKEQLDSLVDQIIQSDVPNRRIEYDGQDEEKLEIMISRFDFSGISPFKIIKIKDEAEDLENNDGSDVETEPVADDKLESDGTESDAGSSCCIAFLCNKIKNFFK